MTQSAHFNSKYTDKQVTSAQLIAERLCELIAAKKKQTLIQQFWQDDIWKKTFTWQVILANRLLKKFSAEALLKALKLPEHRNIVSLATQRYQQSVREIQKGIDSRKDQEYTTIEVAEPSKPREAFPKSKTLDSLGDL